jgi:methionyl aminopeptidase
VHASARAAQEPQPDGQQQQQQLPWLYCTHRGRGRSAAMPSFGWTGPLRPHVIAPPRQVPANIPRPDYSETGYPESEVESKQQRSS